MTPKILCDGVHDDAPGIQAILDGADAAIETETASLRDGFLTVRGAKVEAPLVVRRSSPRGVFAECRIPHPITAIEGRALEPRGLALAF